MGIRLATGLLVLTLLVPAAHAQSAQWVRLALNDGRFVDGQITGGDAINYFVQTPQGYFSIARANVISVTPFGNATATSATTGNLAPMPPPPPPGPMQATAPMPVPAPEASRGSNGRLGAGIGVFAGTYLLTAMIAIARTKSDDDAKLGLIPLVGPMLWTAKNDDDDFMEDGWDWLALGSTLCQTAGLFGIVNGKKQRGGLLSVSPVGARNYGGVAVAGSW